MFHCVCCVSDKPEVVTIKVVPGDPATEGQDKLTQTTQSDEGGAPQPAITQQQQEVTMVTDAVTKVTAQVTTTKPVTGLLVVVASSIVTHSITLLT